MANENWTLMASHGCVLFYLAVNPQATIRQIADAVGLTERRVSQVIHDLAEGDLLTIERRGRRNVYRVNPAACFPHPLTNVRIGEFIEVIEAAGASGSVEV